MRHDDSQFKRSLRMGVRHLLGVRDEESLHSFVEQRRSHLMRRGERALRSFERVLQGLGIAPPAPSTVRPGGPPTPSASDAPRPSRAGEARPSRADRSEPTKFDLGQGAQPVSSPPVEHIPWGYGEDRVTAMPVDPNHLYAYWEITDEAIEVARRGLGAGGEHCWLNLRVYDVTDRIFDGTNAHSYFDHRVERHDRQWFFTIGTPGATVCIETGMKSAEGYFVRIARSARTDLPRAAPAPPGEVEWLAVRSATGELASSHPTPPPRRAAGGSALAQSSVATSEEPEARARNGHHAESPRAPGAGARGETWREIHPGGWHEGRRTVQWVGDVEHSSWQAGPFPFPVDVPRPEIVSRRGEEGSVRQADGSTRVSEGPWEVIIRGIGGHVRQRVLGRWEIVRVGTPEPDADGPRPRSERGVLGGADGALRPGASERRRAGSELRLGGASEEFLLGASELRYRGASERSYAGASERRWLGASERAAVGSGQWVFAGGSERIHAGASEHRLGGASEIVRSARETWQSFAEEGARLARPPAAVEATPPAPPGGASESRLGSASEARLVGASDARVGGASEQPPASPRADDQTADVAVAHAPVPPRW